MYRLGKQLVLVCVCGGGHCFAFSEGSSTAKPSSTATTEGTKISAIIPMQLLSSAGNPATPSSRSHSPSTFSLEIYESNC